MIDKKDNKYLCPFNTKNYAEGLINIGETQMDSSCRIPILRRPIAGTGLSDGVGPWPYMWIDSQDDVKSIYESFKHLVTLSIVTQPGYIPIGRGNDAKLLKHHYVYDPKLPRPQLSRRARARLARCEAIATFEIVSDKSDRMEVVGLYESLKHRRGLIGGLFDQGEQHFRSISEINSSIFFRVLDQNGIGAMACGVVFAGMMQILHIVTSEYGLKWNASYLLMHGMQNYVEERGLRLLTGGMPDAAADGLRTFKERWANDFTPVYLLRIVNDPTSYAELCRKAKFSTDFFPAYRQK